MVISIFVSIDLTPPRLFPPTPPKAQSKIYIAANYLEKIWQKLVPQSMATVNHLPTFVSCLIPWCIMKYIHTYTKHMCRNTRTHAHTKTTQTTHKLHTHTGTHTQNIHTATFFFESNLIL